jgi:hypothetical protein
LGDKRENRQEFAISTLTFSCFFAANAITHGIDLIIIAVLCDSGDLLADASSHAAQGSSQKN